MANTLQFKVVNCRNGGGKALMGFDLAIGFINNSERFVGVLEVRGCFLKQKNDQSGYFVSFPSKLRTDKSGEAVVDDNGYKVYDNIVDLYMEKGANKDAPDKRAVTEAGWSFRKWLIDEAYRAYQDMGASGSSAPTKKAAPAKAAPAKSAPVKAASAKPTAAPTQTADFDMPQDEAESDDDWPF